MVNSLTAGGGGPKRHRKHANAEEVGEDEERPEVKGRSERDASPTENGGIDDDGAPAPKSKSKSSKKRSADEDGVATAGGEDGPVPQSAKRAKTDTPPEGGTAVNDGGKPPGCTASDDADDDEGVTGEDAAKSEGDGQTGREREGDDGGTAATSGPNDGTARSGAEKDAPINRNADPHVVNFSRLTTKELRDECKNRGLAKSGTVLQLMDRLHAFEAQRTPQQPPPPQQQFHQNMSGNNPYATYPMMPRYPYPPQYGMRPGMPMGAYGYPPMGMQYSAYVNPAMTAAAQPANWGARGTRKAEQPAAKKSKASDKVDPKKKATREKNDSIARHNLTARLKDAEEELAAMKETLAAGKEETDSVKDLPDDNVTVRYVMEKSVNQRARLAAENKRLEKKLEQQAVKFKEYREFHNKAKAKDRGDIRRLKKKVEKLEGTLKEKEEAESEAKAKAEIEAKTAAAVASTSKRGRGRRRNGPNSDTITHQNDSAANVPVVGNESSPRKPTMRLQTWDERIAFLEDYKKSHGHIRVHVREKNANMGSWVARIRKEYQYHQSVADEREKHARNEENTGEDEVCGVVDNDSSEREGHGEQAEGTPGDARKGESEKNDSRNECTPYAASHAVSHTQAELGEFQKMYNVATDANTHLKEATASRDGFKPKSYAPLGPLQLTEERIEQLESMGFVWVGTKCKEKKTWDDWFADLLAFKEEHGNVHVPRTFKPDLRLAEWVHVQRRHHTTKMPLYLPGGERYEKLTAAGFEWSRQRIRKSWEARFEQLLDYRRTFGHCNVKSIESLLGKHDAVAAEEDAGNAQNAPKEDDTERDDDEIPTGEDKAGADEDPYRMPCPDGICDSAADRRALFTWVLNLRAHYVLFMHGKKTSLNKNRIRRLGEIGFDWGWAIQKANCETTKGLPGRGGKKNHARWDVRFNTLLEYLKEHGNTRVPQGWKHNRVLAGWVQEQRLQYQRRKRGVKNQMSDERRNRLEEIGFEWSRQDHSKRWGKRGAESTEEAEDSQQPQCAEGQDILEEESSDDGHDEAVDMSSY